jgi:Arc/MetJ family transcription regulator
VSGKFLEEPDEIAWYEHAVRELLRHALGEAESREAIAAMARELDTEASRA